MQVKGNILKARIAFVKERFGDAGWEKVMADERMKQDPDAEKPFNGMRMFYGGFAPIFDTAA